MRFGSIKLWVYQMFSDVQGQSVCCFGFKGWGAVIRGSEENSFAGFQA